MIGQQFSRLTVIGPAEKKGKKSRWLCLCSCGETSIAMTYDLLRGKHRSCGCLRREKITKHGAISNNEVKNMAYRSWLTMRQRCLNHNAPHYERYGGRGIMICDRWLESFNNFLEDMGPRPSMRHTLDRIDNNGNYEPGNCRWATRKEQSYNRSTNRLLTLNGKTMAATAWADHLGWDPEIIHGRLKLEWSDEMILTTPIAPQHGRERDPQTGRFKGIH